MAYWLLMLLFDFCIKMEIWFPLTLNAKLLSVRLVSLGHRYSQGTTKKISRNVIF